MSIDKHLEPSFDLISKLSANPEFEISESNTVLDGCNISLDISRDGIRFRGVRNQYLKDDNANSVSAVLTNNKIVMKVENLIVSSISLHASKTSLKHSFSGVINSISSNAGKDVAFWRLMIPSGKSNNSNEQYFETSFFSSEQYDTIRGLVKISIDAREFHFYEYTYTGEQYFIIDSTTEMKFLEFSNIAYSIIMGIGFITGVMPGDIAWYVSSEDNDYGIDLRLRCYVMRESINSVYCLLHTNPHSYIKDHSEAQKYSDVLKPIPSQVFVNLCKKIHDNHRLRNTVMVFIEANKLPLEIRLFSYAVALEAMTGIISVDYETKIHPIKDRSKRKRIVKKLKTALNAMMDEIDEEEQKFVMNRIDQICTPRNQDKLIKPFEILGIQLSSEERDILGIRNILLHGSPVDPKKVPLQSAENYQAAYYVALHLHSLVSRLILKYIDYNGYIVNYLKVYEKIIKYNDRQNTFYEI